MSYIHSTAAPEITEDQLVLLAGIVGLPLQSEDVPALAQALKDQLASVAALDQLQLGGLAGVTPVLPYDPRWVD